jgi:hypothetical protein
MCACLGFEADRDLVGAGLPAKAIYQALQMWTPNKDTQK